MTMDPNDGPRWYNNADRRTPSQAELMELMARLDERLRREERDGEQVMKILAEVRAEQSAAREERHDMREDMKPLTEALQQARAVRWVLAGLVASVAALAASYAWLKTHVVMAFKATLVAVIVVGAAYAHQAPSGWQYDHACCHERDCVPIPARFVRVGPDGFTVTIPAGAHPFVKDQPLTFSLPHRSDRVRVSGDADYHACINPWRVPLCLYVPPGGV